VDQGQFSDPNFISGAHQRENVQFDDKYLYHILVDDRTKILPCDKTLSFA
jgi:hypothetical protein